jgi:WD40 repeat protein
VRARGTGPRVGHCEPTCVVFSPNGQLIATRPQDTTAKLWTRDGAEHHTLTGHSSGINHLTFSPDSTLLASAASDKATRLWSTTTSAGVHTLHGHTAHVTGHLL